VTALHNGSFDPGRLKKFQDVFDAVWTEISHSVPENEHAAAREYLGSRIIAAAEDGETKFKALKKVALAAFQKVTG
jgi:hypothetical protein